MDEGLVAAELDAVHGVPLPDFVTERNARVKRLRADGHRDEAAALGRVRKPTIAAWAVNQLPRRHLDEVEALLEAGTALRTAQHRAASGRGAEGLRDATTRVRSAVEELADRGAEVLAEVGAAAHHRTEVAQTLFAAATDPDLHDRLRRGVFAETVLAAGFGALAPLVVVPGGDDGADDTTGDVPARADVDTVTPDGAEDARRREQEEARRRELERHRAEVQRALVRGERRVERTEARVDELAARLEDLRLRMGVAEREAERARADLDVLRAELAAVDADLADVETSA